MSLETFKESQERERNHDGQPNAKTKKKRASGADSMPFLKESVEMETQQKLEEMELRRRELQMEKEAREADLKLRAERVEPQQNTMRLQQQ